jgi:hypothetical protein
MPELDGAGLEVDFEAVSGAALELDGAAELFVAELPEELELPHPATARAASTATSVARPRVLLLLCLARAISCILILLVGFLLARGWVQARRVLIVPCGSVIVSSSKDAAAGKCFRRAAAVG